MGNVVVRVLAKEGERDERMPLDAVFFCFVFVWGNTAPIGSKKSCSHVFMNLAEEDDAALITDAALFGEIDAICQVAEEGGTPTAAAAV